MDDGEQPPALLNKPPVLDHETNQPSPSSSPVPRFEELCNLSGVLLPRKGELGKMTAHSSLLAAENSSYQTPQVLGDNTNKRRRKAKGEVDEAKKRRLSEEQVQFLETSFRDERKLASGRKVHLAAEAGLEPKQVAVWFQNRRARHKSKQVEEAYAQLKAAHDAAVVGNCHLENQLMDLTEKLREAEEEIRKLSLVNAERSSSPSSSLSTASGLPLVAGDQQFEVKGEKEELMRIQLDCNLNNYYLMEWANHLYDGI